MQKMASYWLPHHLTEQEKWHRFVGTNLHLEERHNDEDASLCPITGVVKT